MTVHRVIIIGVFEKVASDARPMRQLLAVNFLTCWHFSLISLTDYGINWRSILNDSGIYELALDIVCNHFFHSV